MTVEIGIWDVVLDFDLYPRPEVSGQHVSYIIDALEAGVEMPPIVICKKTKRVVDGFHRIKAYQRLYEKDEKITAHEKVYKNDAELYYDAMKYNSTHGKGLTTYDKTFCILRAKKLKLSLDQIAEALSITIDKLGELEVDRTSSCNITVEGLVGSRQVPLKRTISHMAGKKLTKGQQDANEKLSGMNQNFYVNQIILLIENNLINYEDERLIEDLMRLKGLLSGMAVLSRKLVKG